MIRLKRAYEPVTPDDGAPERAMPPGEAFGAPDGTPPMTIMREYILSPPHQLCVADVMERDAAAVPATLRVDTLFRRLAAFDPTIRGRQAWPIVDDRHKLLGIITRGDLVRALDRLDGSGRTVLDAGTRSPLVVTYPDELLERATQKMLDHDIGPLPVVSREDPTQMVDYLGRAGIMAAWLHVTRQERVREAGWLSEHLRVLRSNLRKLLTVNQTHVGRVNTSGSDGHGARVRQSMGAIDIAYLAVYRGSLAAAVDALRGVTLVYVAHDAGRNGAVTLKTFLDWLL